MQWSHTQYTVDVRHSLTWKASGTEGQRHLPTSRIKTPAQMAAPPWHVTPHGQARGTTDSCSSHVLKRSKVWRPRLVTSAYRKNICWHLRLVVSGAPQVFRVRFVSPDRFRARSLLHRRAGCAAAGRVVMVGVGQGRCWCMIYG